MAKNTDEKLNIQEAIKAFGSNNITDAGINLFSVLGYDTSLQAPLDNKTYQEFKETYIEGSPNEDRFSEEKACVEEWKSIDILFQLTNDSFNGSRSLFEESVNPYDPQSYLCFAIELSNSEYTKSKIAGITREVNKLFSIPIIIIYKYGENLTLAVINRRVNKRDNDRDVLEKVTLIKDIFYSKPHRAHVEILFDMSLSQLSTEYQINNFESLHKAWSEVLDTQTLNKRFYTELSNWYFWAIKTVVYPGYEMEADKDGLWKKDDKIREHNAKNLIRLLTRLLFVWFIKEKDLIPEELFDENKIREIITQFNPDYKLKDNDKDSIYYKAILQNLFFASLNAEHGKRAFRIDGQNQNVTSLMRYQRYHKNPESFIKLIESKVPFMNGGLFECLDHQDDELKGKRGGAIIDYEDGFSDRPDNQLFVPDYIFFGKDVNVDLSTEYDDKKKKDITVNGIINILQKYKFTIAENTPVEEDIALDPELLGRVFENLLASYTPETKTNARKQTGSFYTPRPIVEYMVDESLKAYLKTKIKDSVLNKGTLEEKTAAIAELDKTIDSKLDILVSYNENELDFSEEERKEILRYIDECKILDPACGSGAFPMGILQKMVYVIHKLDPENENWKLLQIEKIMTASNITSKEKNDMIAEISSIFDDNELDYARKLYLIENCIHGIDIQPIATQISRLRFFISLIVDQKVDSTKPNFGVRPLPNLENRFVTANSLIGLDEQQAYLSSKEMDNLLEQLKKVRHDLFKAKTPKHKFELRQQDKEIRGKLEQELISVGFGKKNARLLSTWDPYDKNRSAEFFDAEWMYGIKDGFDVVIGNPPYIDSETMTNNGLGWERDLLLERLDYLTGNWDIYMAFLEIGLKQAKILSFITPDKWLSKPFGLKFRENLMLPRMISICHCGSDVFKSATVDAIITVFNSSNNGTFNVCKYLGEGDIKYTAVGISKDFQKPYLIDFLFSDNYKLIKKIDTVGKKLSLNAECENACATSDCYDLKELIEDISAPDPKKYYKLINTGTISKYINRWGISPITYLGLTPMNPVVSIDKFNKKLGKSYTQRASRKKLILKGLNLLDVCIDENAEFLPGKSTMVICSDDINLLKFLLGILNAKLTFFYIKTKYASSSYCGGINFTKDMFNELSIPDISQNQQQEIITLVDKILAAKKQDSSTDTTEWEKQIDQKVYELYGLTPEEIVIIEGK